MSAAEERSPSQFWVVAVLVAATVLATVLLTRDARQPNADPMATTQVQKAERLAKSKDLQIGLAYGGRLMYMDEAELDESLDRAVRLGAKWVRTDLVWAAVEKSPGAYDWSGFDRVVAATEKRGLELMPIILGAPTWARDPSCAAEWACQPRSMAEYASFAGRAAERYSSYGVKTWQIWNEPNIKMFWTRPNSKAYADMLERSAIAIRYVDPDATIVFGGLAALKPSDNVIEAREFLREVCDAGACEVMDVFAYHPYTYPDLPSNPSRDDASWTRIAEGSDSFVSILDHYGLRRVPIWLTEFGAPTGGVGAASDGSVMRNGDIVDHVTERRQAEIAFDSVVSAVVTPRVKMLVWYTDIDLPDAYGKQAHYGLLRADGTQKPAWRQLRKAIRLFAK